MLPSGSREPGRLLTLHRGDVVDGLEAGQVVVLEHHSPCLELAHLGRDVVDLPSSSPSPPTGCRPAGGAASAPCRRRGRTSHCPHRWSRCSRVRDSRRRTSWPGRRPRPGASLSPHGLRGTCDHLLGSRPACSRPVRQRQGTNAAGCPRACATQPRRAPTNRQHPCPKSAGQGHVRTAGVGFARCDAVLYADSRRTFVKLFTCSRTAGERGGSWSSTRPFWHS